MSISILNNILSDTDIEYILSLSEVINAKKSIDSKSSGSVYFYITLTPSIQQTLLEKFGLKLLSIPMRWIKGDTQPHFDIGLSHFNKTYLTYITDSSGEFLIENNSYKIIKNSAFIFNEGLKHETKNTGSEPRLLLGPMSEQGLAVGTGINIPGGTIIYIRQNGAIIEYSIDKINWIQTFFIFYITNTDPSLGFVKLYFITDITIDSNNGYFSCNSDYIQFGSETLNNDGTRPKITINVLNYDGLIINGTSGGNGFNNIKILNLEIYGATGSQSIGAGWFGQKYFGRGTTNNYIINCLSIGVINSGGILGDYSENITLIGCSSIGVISEAGAGGIVGQYANSVSLQSCWSAGNINGDGCGGIVGSLGILVQITNCYSTGVINGSNSGGIIGSNAGENSVSITNCYSNGDIIGANAGGICGSLAPGDDYTYTVSITNCYSSGNLNNNGINSNGAICGLLLPYGTGTVNLSITHCYTSGTVVLDTGYMIGNVSIVNGSHTTPSQYTLTNNFSESGSGGTPGNWSNINANNTLIGTPNIGYSSSTIWQTIHGIPTPYELFNMGYTPYSIKNISENNLIRTTTSIINPGNSTNSAIIKFGIFYTFLEDYSSLSINIDNVTGAISSTSLTPLGTYTIYIYNTGSYNITTYILIVNNSTPISECHSINFQRISFNQKRGFCGTRPVSTTAIAVGAMRGRGSSTRIFNNCNGNNTINFKLCQLRVFGCK